MNKPAILFLFFSFLITSSNAQVSVVSVSSPNKNIKVEIESGPGGMVLYRVLFQNEIVLKNSRLGLITSNEDFAGRLRLVSSTPVQKVIDRYELFAGKRKINTYDANKRVIHLENVNGNKLDIIFQVSDDGVAFRYYFPGRSAEARIITAELTSFHFDTAARAFLQPMQVAKTGWERTNPAYEEHYRQNIKVTDSSSFGAGWVYPALFQYKGHWVLISESGLDSNYCGTRLQSQSPDGEYKVGFPDPREIFPGGGVLPRSKLPFYSPWRVIAVGNLKTIAESTLGTDVATPAIQVNRSTIKPGKSSWSWVMSKDDSIVYSEQVRYIDFAASMKWQYCLIDVNWDQKIGYEKMQELSAYAASKNVGLLLWYNSSGDWNTVRYTPKGKLLTHEDRIKEFGRIQQMGIKGVKIDFFGGDGQSVIKYYIDILHDAARFGLLVNFHGATLPRGWQRTYPHLMTMESIKGFEFITFTQADADVAANHCAMLPFTRNVFDPMDFTPMNLYRIQSRVRRKTTSSFELATSVLFLSGIQHMAESPAGMSHVPGFVHEFLRQLPDRWDDVQFLDGYPGKYVVLARRAGNKWYLACINGENTERTIRLDLRSFKKKKAVLITDGEDPLSFVKKDVSTGTNQLVVQPNGGFVIIME